MVKVLYDVMRMLMIKTTLLNKHAKITTFLYNAIHSISVNVLIEY